MVTTKSHTSLKGMGTTLQESATIAFNTATGHYFNPETGDDLGTDVPTGGWAISWFRDSSGNVDVVPYGTPATVAQSASQASALAQSISGHFGEVNSPQIFNVTSGQMQTVGAPTNTTNQTSAGTNPQTGFQLLGYTITTNEMLLAAGVIAAAVFMMKGKH